MMELCNESCNGRVTSSSSTMTGALVSTAARRPSGLRRTPVSREGVAQVHGADRPTEVESRGGLAAVPVDPDEPTRWRRLHREQGEPAGVHGANEHIPRWPPHRAGDRAGGRQRPGGAGQRQRGQVERRRDECPLLQEHECRRRDELRVAAGRDLGERAVGQRERRDPRAVGGQSPRGHEQGLPARQGDRSTHHKTIAVLGPDLDRQWRTVGHPQSLGT